jgi:hypothetical protein
MIIAHRDKVYKLPFSLDWPHSMTTHIPNKVLLEIDERDFDRRFGRCAVWVSGSGPYATLAYCGGELTICRWSTLEKAVEGKRAIDGGGCGGGCCKAHLIAHIDPQNGHHAREEAWIDKVIAEQNIQPSDTWNPQP